MTHRLVLIDGNAILHRAYHALPGLTNAKGEMTNAVYGFVSMLFRVIENLKPTHLAVTFDRKAPTFRKKLFKEYQSHRPKMEDGLIGQIGKVHEVVEAMQIPIYELDGYEADDLLGTIANQVRRDKQKVIRNKSLSPVTSRVSPNAITEVVIVTGDRDLLQLVNEDVKLFMPVKGLVDAKLFGEKEAEERMGVAPKYVVDLKALMGDPSDNYPGIAGIGPKTAVGLIQQYGHLEEIYKHVKDIKNPGVVEKLEKDKDNAWMSHKLATVVTDVPIEFDLERSVIKDMLTKEVIDLFGDLGFRTLLKRLTKINEKKDKVISLQTSDVRQNVKKNQDAKKDEQMGLF